MIPDEAVEAAARAMLDREPDQQLWGLLDIKAGLEAAAPHLLAGAVADDRKCPSNIHATSVPATVHGVYGPRRIRVAYCDECAKTGESIRLFTPDA